MIYDYEKYKNIKKPKWKFILAGIAVALLILLTVGISIYLEIIQLDEIGGLSGIFITNLMYKVLFAVAAFVAVFLAIFITNVIIKSNMKKYFTQNQLPQKRLPNSIIAIVFAFITALGSRDVFYLKALEFFNSTPFNSTEKIFNNDIGYYIFQRPFFMSLYSFITSLWVFVIIYTVVYYAAVMFAVFNTVSLKDLKLESIMRHILINIAVFFLIKTVSYKFLKEGLLYSNVVNVKGANFVDVNVWMKYYSAAPFVLIILVLVTLAFVWKGKLKNGMYTVAVFPALWVIATIAAMITQSLVVSPNELKLEKTYLQYNIEKTREAYGIDKISTHQFNLEPLTKEVLNRNEQTASNIRIVDYNSTLISNIQLQSNTLFYTFNDGDIINYTINGKESPVFITAREIDKNKLQDNTYINSKYKYTHGYGIVINPINKIGSNGQVEFILSDLRLKSQDPSLKVKEPRIYYGELTKDYVIVNAGNGLNEIDYDGNSDTRYNGNGGLRLNFINRLLFAAKFGDFKLITSGYASNAKIMLNREIIDRAAKAVPFLTIDKDPYILLTSDGRLKWVLDGYTSTNDYPYSQSINGINYVRNSVKVVIDAYDGNVKYYIVDKKDPIINTYKKIYPTFFSDEPLPADIMAHSRYPELLFKIQTEIMKRYHIEPKQVSTFYEQQDVWDIARFSDTNDSAAMTEMEPFYNMVKLPEGIGEKEELILMRPFTPAGAKHNMVSWLAVRNSSENYGELILFSFPKNTNIFGPNQIKVKINQIADVSRDMTLWGQSGSDVYKGSMMVIPIENSILYVEPIYIRASGESSTPEIRKIIVGYQDGDDFIYGVGTNLQRAIDNMFEKAVDDVTKPQNPSISEGDDINQVSQDVVNKLLEKYDALKKQIEDIGKLIDELK